ncbi:hypothetical protein ACHAXS_005176 [Conticribra weissflogii]
MGLTLETRFGSKLRSPSRASLLFQLLTSFRLSSFQYPPKGISGNKT